MIYSRFGSALTLVSKHAESEGRLLIQATAGGTADIREYRVEELKADGGTAEIDQAVAKLPLKAFAKKVRRER